MTKEAQEKVRFWVYLALILVAGALAWGETRDKAKQNEKAVAKVEAKAEANAKEIVVLKVAVGTQNEKLDQLVAQNHEMRQDIKELLKRVR